MANFDPVHNLRWRLAKYGRNWFVVLAVMLSSHHLGILMMYHKAHRVKNDVQKTGSAWCVAMLSERESYIHSQNAQKMKFRHLVSRGTRRNFKVVGAQNSSAKFRKNFCCAPILLLCPSKVEDKFGWGTMSFLKHWILQGSVGLFPLWRAWMQC